MSMIRILVAVVLLVWKRIRGPSTVHEMKHTQQHLGSLTGVSIRGYEVAIYCQRKEYHVVYEKWYIPNNIRRAYNVFSVVSNDAPKALRKACELDVDLPELSHRWNFETEIRRAQVHAYLDMLEKRMAKIEVTT